MKRLLLAGALVHCALFASTDFAQEKVQRTAAPVEGGAPPPPIKVPLSGKALEKYSQAKKSALEYLAGNRCSSFLRSHGLDPTDLSQALAAQKPQDGPASKITFGTAGIIASDPDPHSGDSVQAAFTDPTFLTMAVSQPHGSDTYFNPALLTRKIPYPYSNPVSLIHEALHNLTGESDVAIAQDLGYRGFVALEANVFINDTLKKNCDSKR